MPIFASAIISVILAVIGYFLGVRQTKKQALSKYIAETAGDLYPSLFSEIKEELELLDNYLEEPNITFNFRELDKVYSSGLERFIETHHKELFLKLDSFHKRIVPKFLELNSLFLHLWNNMFAIWSNYLEKSLPQEVVSESKNIAHDLSKSPNPYYIFPDLLNERFQEIRNKTEACILENTSHLYLEKAKRPFVIEGQNQVIGFDEISKFLIEKAEPRVKKVIATYRELKKQTDREVRQKLLPLIQEYISNPI